MFLNEEEMEMGDDAVNIARTKMHANSKSARSFVRLMLLVDEAVDWTLLTCGYFFARFYWLPLEPDGSLAGPCSQVPAVPLSLSASRFQVLRL